MANGARWCGRKLRIGVTAVGSSLAERISNIPDAEGIGLAACERDAVTPPFRRNMPPDAL